MPVARATNLGEEQRAALTDEAGPRIVAAVVEHRESASLGYPLAAGADVSIARMTSMAFCANG